MKKISLFFSLLFLISLHVFAQVDSSRFTEIWNPVPKKVTAGKNYGDAPSDAVILFNGKDFSNWESDAQKPSVQWKLVNDAMTVGRGTGGIRTKEKFGDCQLHIEWRSPDSIKGAGQGRGNSGIFLMGRYELQVLDSYESRTYSNGQAGSIYKQHIPLVNATRAPGEWQTYDVIFTAPRFKSDSSLISPARITVLHNNILVQNNVTLWGATQYIGVPSYKMHSDKESIVLQDHGDAVSFRNIWIRNL